jgi:predicted component of type VI protein secretion system
MKATLVMFRSGERRDFPLTTPSTIVGRRQDCTLRIPTKDVSRRHCEILIAGNKISVKDLGSANGTYVNGKRVAELPLAAGDKLRVGPVTFMVQVDGQPPKITPHDLLPQTGAAGTAAAKVPAGAPVDEDDLFDLDDADFDLDDPITALNGPGEDDEDDEPRKPPPKK